MASYTVHMMSEPSSPAQPDDAEATTETREAADTADFWASWISDLRYAIEEAGGDSDDPDTLLASIMDSIGDEITSAVAAAEERAIKYAANILHRAEDSNQKVALALRREREARDERRIEGEALAKRFDRINSAIEKVERENVELRAKLTACEENLAKATAMLEREIAKERSLRRLLDAQRSRPHTQKIASELAKRHAQKALESAMKDKTERAA
jgi:hypothetical protein